MTIPPIHPKHRRRVRFGLTPRVVPLSQRERVQVIVTKIKAGPVAVPKEDRQC